MRRPEIDSLEARNLFAFLLSLGSTGFDGAYKAAIDPAGNYVTAGVFSGTVDFDPTAGVKKLTAVGNTDIYVAKYTPAGSLLWAGQIGGGAGDIDDKDFDRDIYSPITATPLDFINRKSTQINGLGEYINDLALDGAGNVYLAGNYAGTIDADPTAGAFSLPTTGSRKYQDAFVIKLTAAGTLSYARHFGGQFDDVARSLAVDSAGNVTAVGYFTRQATFGKASKLFAVDALGREDGYVIRLDATGGTKWVTVFGGETVTLFNRDYATDVALDSSGNAIVVGDFTETLSVSTDTGRTRVKQREAAGDTDGVILSLSSAGKLRYVQSLGGDGVSTITSVALAADNTIAIGGSFSGTSNLSTSGTALAIADDNDQYDDLTGSDTSGVDTDMFLSKLDANANTIWAKPFASDAFTMINEVAVDSAGAVYAAGAFAGAVDFDPGRTNDVRVSGRADDRFKDGTKRKNSFDGFVSKFAASGRPIGTQQIGSTSDDFVSGIAVTSSDAVLVAGQYRGSVLFPIAGGATTIRRRSAGLQESILFLLDGTNFVA